jgi:crossover junction endodeoxyribonuclease RusA
MEEITITLPLPHRDLSPNSRKHYRKKASVTKTYRVLAGAITAKALLCSTNERRCRYNGYSLKFFFPNAIRRDDDNAEASCKAYRDGIADALRMDDHGLKKLALSEFTIDRKTPRLEITIYPTPTQ